MFLPIRIDVQDQTPRRPDCHNQLCVTLVEQSSGLPLVAFEVDRHTLLSAVQDYSDECRLKGTRMEGKLVPSK